MPGMDGAALRFDVLTGFWERLRGLLGTDEDADSVALVRCGSVHTFGMAYPIDVAFVHENGTVLESVRGLRPGRLCGCRGSWIVLERPSSPAPWPDTGQEVRMTLHGDTTLEYRGGWD